MSKNQWVTPRTDGWAVKGEGNTRATKVYPTQQEAITHAKGIAKRNGSELIIQGKDNRIREKNSYGKDPFPPKG
ncbi:hypothetical protein QF022_002492 [Vogesella perlucida]|nr:hypothetical protein [Vogesella perlucida]